ncbi:MAG: adenylate cyclase [Eubacterium sp.]|nr:adenylate cyclase [Eubacterium sp.]
MKNVKSLCIRFNLMKNRDKSAWDIIHNLDKKKWKSYSNAVILAVSDFFDRQNKIKSDPYFETREREEKFVGEIVSSVEKAISREIPKFLSFCFGEIIRQYGEKGGRNPSPVSINSAPIIQTEKQEVSENVLSENNDYSDFDINFMGE